MTTVDELFPGDDITSRTHRTFDWSTTSLGPVESWPDSLVSAVRTVVPSGIAMLLWWGEDLVQIFNDAYTPLAGNLFPAAVGQRAADCWASAWEQVGPLVDSVRDGTVVHAVEQRFLLDRSGYVEESFFTFSYSPIRGDGDKVLGVFVATNDVTDRVLSDRRMATLRDLESLSSASDNIAGIESICRTALDRLSRGDSDVPFAAAFLRRDGRTAEVASYGVTGFDDTARWDIAGVADDVASTGTARTVEVDGRAVPVLPLRGSGDEPIGAVALGISEFRRLDESYRLFLELVARRVSAALTDVLSRIAERERAADQAELDAAKTRFFENVSHEFRTPLTLLLGPLDEILNDRSHDLGERYARSLQAARRAALRLQRLVDTVLDVSRLDAGKLAAGNLPSGGFTVTAEPTDVAMLTAECVALFQDAARRAGVTLTADVEGLAHPVVDLDRSMWTHVLMNLLSNAVKFTTDGSIAVALREQVDVLELTVTDTGPGIDESEREKIFERFYQVAGTVGRSREGSGVGLSLVSDLVAAVDGSVTVADSLETGHTPRGATFTVSVPRTVSAAQHASPLDAARALGAGYIGEADTWRPVESMTAEPAANQRRVVLVEDNADMRDYLVGLLADQNWHVAAFADADAALAHSRTAPPDAIVSDIMLPGRSGLDLVDEARSDGRLVRIPIVLLSARAGSESIVEGLRLGADDYVTKPFQPAELIARIRVLLELARLREQLLGTAEREASSLRTALDSRSVLSQAVGILMVTERLTPKGAFDRISTLSQAANVKARVIAEQIVTRFVAELETGADI